MKQIYVQKKHHGLKDNSCKSVLHLDTHIHTNKQCETNSVMITSFRSVLYAFELHVNVCYFHLMASLDFFLFSDSVHSALVREIALMQRNSSRKDSKIKYVRITKRSQLWLSYCISSIIVNIK